MLHTAQDKDIEYVSFPARSQEQNHLSPRTHGKLSSDGLRTEKVTYSGADMEALKPDSVFINEEEPNQS